MKKTLSIVALAVLTISVGAVVYLYLSFGTLVKSGVESYGPQFTQTKVTLGGVQASLFGGKVGISDLFIGNPKGYKTSHAFKVGTVRVVVDRGTLASDVIHIKEITIDAPNIIYEKGKGGSNFDVIQKNVAEAANDKGKTEKSTEADKDADKGEGPKLVIDNLYIRNAKVAFSASFLGGKVIPIPMPDIHLKDIGKEKKGASPADVAKKVIDKLTGSITGAVAGINMDAIKKQTKAITEGAKGALEDATKGIKSLFGK